MIAVQDEAVRRWVEAFEASPKQNGLQPLRQAGMEAFTTQGFPTPRLEAWKWTNLRPLMQQHFKPAAGKRSGKSEWLGKVADATRHPFVGLNSAFLGDVIVIEVPRGEVVADPVELDFLEGAEGTSTHPRIVIVLGENAQLSVVERYAGRGTYFTNPVTEVVLGQGAILNHYKIQTESEAAFHIGHISVRQERDSHFRSHLTSLGGALVRHDIEVALSAPGAECTLDGLYMVGGKQHVDTRTYVDHASDHCTSNQVYKGVLDGKSSAAFQGSVLVRKDAQKTDAHQTNKNLLLSLDAVINTKPELQINADDVKCTHGAAIGQLDDDALFYLRARGIGDAEARHMLTWAFASDIIARAPLERVRQSLEALLWQRFGVKP